MASESNPLSREEAAEMLGIAASAAPSQATNKFGRIVDDYETRIASAYDASEKRRLEDELEEKRAAFAILMKAARRQHRAALSGVANVELIDGKPDHSSLYVGIATTALMLFVAGLFVFAKYEKDQLEATRLVVVTDVACMFWVDGEPVQGVMANKKNKIAVKAGTHQLRALVHGKEMWSGEVEITEDYPIHRVNLILTESVTEFASSGNLFGAADNNNADEIRSLLASGADITVFDEEGLTAMHRAARKGNNLVIQAMLFAEIDANLLSATEATPLAIAASYGQVSTITILIQNGGLPNLSDKDGHSALYEAVIAGEREALSTLLAAGGNVDATDLQGNSLLFAAANQGKAEVVRHLISAGASQELANDVGDIPLFQAVKRQNAAVIKLLAGRTSSRVFKNRRGDSALHVAAAGGSPAVVKLLITAGMAVDNTASRDETPLHRASMFGKLAVVKVLLENGAEVRRPSRNGNTALSFAAKRGQAQTVEYLLDNRADVNAMADDGSTPVLKATEAGNLIIVRKLIAAGAVVNIGYNANSWKTPLYIAAEGGNLALVEALLGANANVNAGQSDEKTALSIAQEKGFADIANKLIAAGATQ